MKIREFRPDDTDALYEICLRTVDAGNDGTPLYPAYPELPGHLALGANLILEPEFAFVLLDGTGVPVGYVVGAVDTRAFYGKCEQLWWPPLRERYPDPDDVAPEHHTPEQRLLHAIHQPILAPDAVLDAYPSHLHINLMPPAQGRGYGRLLLQTLFAALRDAGSGGIFLGVPPANTRAIGFYHRMGFHEIPNLPPHWSLRLGKEFSPGDAADA
ncbi:MAG TPA: GNAT family N-acetyltransferase [Streptosporangiaceae bacterium]|nr:GNAT family N-acetyltransferase [Streptosporangiaceae bacterium]